MKTRLTDPKIEVTFGPLDLTHWSDQMGSQTLREYVLTLSISQARRLRDAITLAIIKYADDRYIGDKQ